MILEIDDNKTLAELQDSFQAGFPFLQLVFFEHGHHWNEAMINRQTISTASRIGDIRKGHKQTDIELFPTDRTGDVEQKFIKKYNLNVQIYRKAGMQWVETAGTDDLTLEEQNEIGRKGSQN